MEQHVPVSEDLVEKLTPNKDVGENEIDERNKILEGIAEGLYAAEAVSLGHEEVHSGWKQGQGMRFKCYCRT